MLSQPHPIHLLDNYWILGSLAPYAQWTKVWKTDFSPPLKCSVKRSMVPSILGWFSGSCGKLGLRTLPWNQFGNPQKEASGILANSRHKESSTRPMAETRKDRESLLLMKDFIWETNLPFRLNFKLLVQAFSQLQVEDSLWIPLTTCAPCGSGCFVSWLWLLCDPSMISIFTRLPWMLTPRRSLKRWRRQTPRRISPFLVALSRTGNQQHDQKIRRHARAKSEERCKQRSEKCKWCETKWQCPGKEEYWSRRWTIEPMGGSLTPVEVWVSEICQSPLSSTLETSKPVSLCGLYGANRKKLSFAKCALLEYWI